MTIKERDILEKILAKLDDMNIRSEKLERGIYGDDANNFKGLIQRQDADEVLTNELQKRLDKIEYNNKLAWGGISGLVGSGGLLYYLWDKITS